MKQGDGCNAWVDPMSRLDPAYTAGLFDGEGFVVVRGGEGQIRHLTLLAGISMTEPQAIQLIHEEYGGSLKEEGRVKRDRTRRIYDWYILGQPALDFLEDIYPYSMVKTEQIREALKFPHTGHEYGRHRPLPNDIRLQRQSVKDNLVRLRRPDV